MNRYKINKLVGVSLVLFSIFLSGCSTVAEPDTAKTNNVNQSPPVNSNVPVNLPDNAATPSVNNTPASNVNGNSNAKSADKPAPAAAEPKPVIGSGGQDLLVFKQVRAALDQEKEFISGILIDIKEGNITLNGKVSSNEQKAKAEQLVKKVEGVKTVKNNLQVSQ